MGREMIDGPDFICIGMPKSGTGWLFDQVKFHPDFWMPPVKELAYLTEESGLKLARQRLEKIKTEPHKPKKFLEWSSTGDGDLRAIEFLKEAAAAAGKPRDLQDYARLFRYKGSLLSGDVTALYSGLGPEMIARVAEELPKAKILFLAREPVERAWSQLCMWCRAGTISEKTATTPELLSSFVRKNGKFARLSFPSRIAATWKKNAPQLQFRTFLFDDIAQDAERVRHEILLYVGADPAKQNTRVDADFNKKASLKKIPLSDAVKAVLVDYFREELLSSAAMFGGAAMTWPQRHGLQ